MAISRGLRRGRTTRSSRRRTSWEVGPGGTTPTVITASGNAFLGSAVTPLADGLTVARIRGQLMLYLSTATTILDGFAGAFGIGKTTTQAVTAGAGSVPTPIDEQDWDGWLFHQYFALKAPVVVGGGGVQTTGGEILAVSAALRMDVDTKAMRKLNQEDAIYAMIQVTEVGTAQMNVAFDSRMLVFLP